MAFVNAADMATYLQIPLPQDQAALIMAVDMATSVVVSRTGQEFEAVNGDVVTLDPDGDTVWLPQRPVTAVTSVVTRDLGSTVATPRTVNLEYEVRGPRLRWVGPGVWPYEVTVTYDHGYATIPADVQAATLAVAAELYANPSGLSSETIDDYTWRASEGEESLADRLLAGLVRRYGRRPLTVRLG